MGTTGGPRPRRRRVELLLALGVALLSAFVVRDWTAQPSSRYLFTVAVVDDHALQLDPYVDILGVDRAVYDGHVYSDKSPYQPLLATAPFQVYRWLGGSSFPTDDAGRVNVTASTFVGLWWVTLWSSVLPAIALAVVVRRIVSQTRPNLATPVAVALLVGTTALPFTSWLFGHALAALWIALAWLQLRSDRGSELALVGAGALLGLAIGTEYAVAVLALVLLVHVLLTSGVRSAAVLSAGTILAIVPLLIYNAAVFGSPFEVSYQGHLPNFRGAGALGVYNLEVPRLGEVAKTLFGDRGLFVMTPIILLAVIGCGLCIAARGRLRHDGIVALAGLTLLVVVSVGVDGYGGDSPGPRYLIPAFPLLAVPLAEVWHRAPRPAAIAAAIGAFWMLSASLTNPAIISTDPRPVHAWVDRVVRGDLADNVLTGHASRWILYITTGAGLVALGMAIRAERATSAVP